MNTNLLFTLLILLYSSTLFSQAMWGSYDKSPNGVHFNTIEICSDSVPENFPWQKMYITTQGVTNSFAGRRIIGDSVLFKFNLASNDVPILLYNYDLEVGDTLNRGWGEFLVNEVDTLFFLGKDRKRIIMEETTTGQIDEWLFGIGSLVTGYLKEWTPSAWDFNFTEFSCYLNTETNEYYYHNSDPSLCLLLPEESVCLTSSNFETIQIENIKIYPNPIIQILNIQLDDIPNCPITIDLFNMNGSLCVSKNIQNSKYSLDVSNLNSGMYLLRLTSDKSQTFHKVMIH